MQSMWPCFLLLASKYSWRLFIWEKGRDGTATGKVISLHKLLACPKFDYLSCWYCLPPCISWFASLKIWRRRTHSIVLRLVICIRSTASPQVEFYFFPFQLLHLQVESRPWRKWQRLRCFFPIKKYHLPKLFALYQIACNCLECYPASSEICWASVYLFLINNLLSFTKWVQQNVFSTKLDKSVICWMHVM